MGLKVSRISSISKEKSEDLGSTGGPGRSLVSCFVPEFSKKPTDEMCFMASHRPR